MMGGRACTKSDIGEQTKKLNEEMHEEREASRWRMGRTEENLKSVENLTSIGMGYKQTNEIKAALMA